MTKLWGDHEAVIVISPRSHRYRIDTRLASAFARSERGLAA
jgi:hypothetical protein